MTQPSQRVAVGWILRYRREERRVVARNRNKYGRGSFGFKFACTRALETSRLRSHEVSGRRCTLDDVNWIRIHVGCAAGKGAANCLERSRPKYSCDCKSSFTDLDGYHRLWCLKTRMERHSRMLVSNVLEGFARGKEQMFSLRSDLSSVSDSSSTLYRFALRIISIVSS